MIPEIGHFALILCLALSIVQGVLPLVGAARGSGPLMAVARPAAAANALFGTIAFGCPGTTRSQRLGVLMKARFSSGR